MTRLVIGDAALVRVPYADILVDPAVVTLTPEQVGAIEWAAPTWATPPQVGVAAAVWIIESAGMRIVVDPALAADDILRSEADAAAHQDAVAKALSDAGYPRESIDVVVASHIDGIGMIAWRDLDGWTPFFPNASVLLSKREYNALAGGEYTAVGSDALFALEGQGAVACIDDAHTVTPEVTIEWTGGHAPGHQIVRVASGGDTAIFVGHLALTPLQCATLTGVHYDNDVARAALQRLRDSGALLVGPLWPTPGAARWTGTEMAVTYRA
jgi:glyoxylase-like metal-dependent hydrolase (beta-lactamase superfamily II)